MPPVYWIKATTGVAAWDTRSFSCSRTSCRRKLVGRATHAFAAYALPGLPAESLPEGMTPVNVVRLVLRHYLNADLPPLPDRSYWSPTNQPFAFTQVP